MDGTALLMQDEAFKFIQNRLDSGEWWTIIVHDELSQKIATLIEERFYLGEKNSDFEIIMTTEPCLAICFAKKKQMTASQLLTCLNADWTSPMNHKTDIIFCPTPSGIAAALWLDENFRNNRQHPPSMN